MQNVQKSIVYIMTYLKLNNFKYQELFFMVLKFLMFLMKTVNTIHYFQRD